MKNPVEEQKENLKLLKGENYLVGSEMKSQKRGDFIANGPNGVNVI